ncbi:MAG: 2,3-bisphosphoglycerate-independent phosphoglycerate mutase [Thermanaeromonas sp.]|uniref:2,3-bisphosphoglycerate-independent phosphoglycerate mutase n=1 Tax=Thermanaeromonas sp. TaxID=2003697 RepID=UPI00243E564D|nr:2,3-bisphosphoglycerate-independent phosphoglycerate mutase [Thermanaeromonas sp.]MCG0278767.1 2,3-bisphosphoglycerate-independent phosphoglycerate mutase [Thermanaeromonas sp.]
MLPESFLEELSQPSQTKMVLVVLDGLGGLPVPELGNKTELEAASTPNLDELAARSSLGLAHPVMPGITPGSSAGHLALFGYDPTKYVIGRGILEALGIGFDIKPQDIAIRGNFCTVEKRGSELVVTDRRAGRPSTDHTVRICQRLQEIIRDIEGVEVFIRPVKEHRFVVVLRGEGLDPRVKDTDPQKEGVAPLTPEPLAPEASRTASVTRKLLERIGEILADEPQTNYALLRGFSSQPGLTPFPERFKLKAGAIAVYPMYRGLASLVGMDVLALKGETLADEISTLKEQWGSYDFFFLHIKATDSRGEDGDFNGKIKVIEDFDKHLPSILELKPDVLVITGDHSTPSIYAAHSWHPVPFLLHSCWVRAEREAGFNEYACARGMLGQFPLLYTMNLMLAHAGRLEKFSA